MNRYRQLALLLAALVLTSTSDSVTAKPPPNRTASDAPKKDFALAQVEASAYPIGVVVRVVGAVAKPKKGNKYGLYYQLRLHTRKGQAGPTLGTKDYPDGKPFFLQAVNGEYDWIMLSDEFDVTRQEVSGMKNLPHGSGEGARLVLLRVEPHLYDFAKKAYLTPTRTPAAIVVASVDAHGKVIALMSLAEYLIGASANPKKALDLLADLDEFDTTANGIEEAIIRVLTNKDVGSKNKLLYIRAVPARTLKTKAGFNLESALTALAKGSDEELKKAAQEKLAEK
jgi:hypothetical protein